MSKTTLLKVDDQQHATILAALRFYQQKGQGDPANRSLEIHEIATNGDEVISLDDDGIDELCQLINCGVSCPTNDQHEVELPLANGWKLVSGVYDPGPGSHTCGEYVRLCDEDGNEHLYWDQEEWREDPDLVMGAIINAACQQCLAELDPEQRAYLDRLQELATEMFCDMVHDITLFEVDQLQGERHISEGDDGVWVRAWVLVENDRLKKAGLLEDEDEDEEHEHQWGPVEHARFTGNPHRKYQVPGCKVITLDLEDEDDTEPTRISCDCWYGSNPSCQHPNGFECEVCHNTGYVPDAELS